MKTNGWRLCVRQIGGMILYEMRRHWRRRGLSLVSLLWTAGIILSGWGLQLNASIAEIGPPLSESLVAKRSIWTNGLLMGTAVLSTFFAFFVITVIIADTVAYDQQLDVLEWLTALPLQAGTYLAGKLCGMWGAVLTALVTVMLFGGVGYGFAYGPFDTAVYLQLWSGTAAIALLVSGISVLVAANVSSRRLALFLGLITAVCCFFTFIPGYIDYFQNINNTYAKHIMPEIIADFCDIDPTTCNDNATLNDEDMIDLPVELPTFGITLLRGIATLAIAYFATWEWQKWQLEKR